MYADDIKVKEVWFVPHFPPREDKQLELAMVREWKDYMSYEDFFSTGWSSRLATEILARVPGGQNGRTARVAATFALWCVMPIGRGFLDPLLRKVKEGKEGSVNNLAIAAWALENQLELLTNNKLVMLLSDGQGKPFYKHKPYPTLSDHRAVELTLCFLVSKEGRNLLKRVCQSSSERDWIPF